jgi:hypothetical protein
MSNTRTVALAAMLGAVTIGGATACSGVFNRLEDGVVRDEPVTEVALAGGGGDVKVLIDSSVKGVDIRRSVRYLGESPSIGDTVLFASGVVTLRTDCGSRCSASYEVRMPAAGVKVTGDNGSGDISLHDVSDVDIEVGSGNVTIDRASGAVHVENGSGDIKLADVTGATTITTGSGNVTGSGLRGPTTSIEVSSGDIDLDVPGTGDVKVVTGSGNIEVRVPNNTVRFIITSNSGNQKLDVTPDPASPRVVDLRTSSGDVTVRPSL